MARLALLLVILLLAAPVQAQSLEDVLKRIELMELAFEIGNQRAASMTLEQLEPPQLTDARLAGLFKEAGMGAEMVESFRLEMELTRLGVLEMSGLHSQVIEQGKRLLPRASKDPARELHLRLLLVQAGRKGAFPAVVRENLPRVTALAPTIQDNFGRFSHFLALSFQFELEDTTLSSDQLLTQASLAWKLWEELPLGTKDLAFRQWRWGFDGVGVWRQALLARHVLEPDNKRIVELLDRQEEEMKGRAGREYQAYRETFDINIGYVLGLSEETLRDARRCNALGLTERAQRRLAEANHFAPGLFHDKFTNRALSLGWKEEGAFPFTQFSEFYVAYGQSELTEASSAQGTSSLGLLEKAALQFTKASNRGAEVEFLIEATESLLRAKPAGWKAKAQAWTERSSKLSRQLGSRPGRIASLINSAELLAESGQSQKAIQQLREATAEIELYVTEAGSEHSLQPRFQRAYDLLTRYQLSGGDVQEALHAQLRARQVEQLAGSRIQAVTPEDSKLAHVVKVNRQARARVRAAEAEQSAAANAGQELKPADREKAEFYRSLEAIKAVNPRYAEHLAVRPLNFAALQSSLPAGTSLIVLAPDQDRTYLFVLSQQSLVMRESAVGYEALRQQVAKFRRSTARSPDKGSKAMKGALAELYSALVEPIEDDINGQKVLAFVPTRALIYLPLQALTDAQGAYLAERFQVAVVLKDSDLDGLRRPSSQIKGPLFAFGNPDGTLPAAAVEAQGVGELFEGGKVFVRNEATEQQLNEIQGQVNILHLATHGVLDSRSPQSSYLTMAGSGAEARLTLGEVYGLALNKVSLVTLSACETSLGRANPGSEVSSLAAAFSIASAQSAHPPTVLASLWKVDDKATSRLMLEFYSQLKAGASKGRALQSAQLKLMEDPATASPYFWAPFVLIGDWR